MAFNDTSDEGVACFCAFVESLTPGLKDEIKNIVSVLEGLIDVLKAAILLAGTDWVDEARKLQYQAELKAIRQIAEPLSAPLVVIESYIRPFADCDFASNFAAQITHVKNEVLSGVEEAEYDLEQLIAALDDKNKFSDLLDTIDETFKSVVEAIEVCDQQ